MNLKFSHIPTALPLLTLYSKPILYGFSIFTNVFIYYLPRHIFTTFNENLGWERITKVKLKFKNIFIKVHFTYNKYTYLKCTVWWDLTNIHTHITHTTIKIEHISVTPEISFMVIPSPLSTPHPKTRGSEFYHHKLDSPKLEVHINFY